MKNLKIGLLMVATMVCGFSLHAQDFYPKESDFDEYSYSVKFSGERPTIKDFINAYVAEPEDEFTGMIYEVWQSYLKNEPQPADQKIIVDTKNGFVCIESTYQDDDRNYKTITEFCYWNCADGKHKVFCESSFTYLNGKPDWGWQYDGITFFVYNNDLRKMTLTNMEDMGVYIKTERDIYASGFDGENYYCENFETGVKKTLSKSEYDKWEKNLPVVTYSLPRAGKDIIATIHKPDGDKQIKLTWNGYCFK